MTKKGPHQKIEDLVEKYKRSTQAYYSACDDDNFAKQKTMGLRVNKIVQELDSIGVDGRLALIPLLDDADQGIRTFAAADLLKIMPERAIPVLEEIRNGLTYFPRYDAGKFLDSYAAGKWGHPGQPGY